MNIRRLVVLLVVMAAACGNSTKSATVTTPPSVGSVTSPPIATSNLPVTTLPTATSTTAASSTTTAAPVPKGPAFAPLTFVGDPGLAGASSRPVISCNSPNLDGSVVIRVLAQPATPDVLFNMTLSPGKIVVLVAAGSGTAYTSRTFEGTGVTTFSSSTGAMIDTQLTETTAAAGNRGTIGAITSVTGSVDCGNQTVGTSTVTYSGQTLEGAVNGGADPFRVECNTSSQGDFVSLVGIVTVGSAKALFFTSFTPDAINSFESLAGPSFVQHQYFVKSPGMSTLTPTGAHVIGDIVEQSPANGQAHTLHIEGDVVCGATVNR